MLRRSCLIPLLWGLPPLLGLFGCGPARLPEEPAAAATAARWSAKAAPLTARAASPVTLLVSYPPQPSGRPAPPASLTATATPKTAAGGRHAERPLPLRGLRPRLPSGAGCVAGACGAACPPLYADCDGNPANGCESKSGPLAYYRMNEGGLVSVADSAGVSPHLLLDDTQAPSFIPASPPGTTPGAMHCTVLLAGRICARSAGFLRLPNASQLTVQAWVRATDLLGSAVALYPTRRPPPSSAYRPMAAATWPACCGAAIATVIRSPRPAPPPPCATVAGTLLAMTADGSNLRLFLDGAQVASRAPPYTTIQPVRNGTLQLVNTSRGDVDIDEVRVYAYARSAAEISSDALTFCRALTGCGSCTTAPPHAVPLCEGSRCSFRCCPFGWADCDGSATNGCEVDPSSSASSCGACGNVCPGGTAARCQGLLQRVQLRRGHRSTATATAAMPARPGSTTT